ncbi:MAG: molybdopterin molybdotransferase MoeA [SAR324 cluster bacterium]|nr:molybdopterin molybdotransferase MoeA [SAR324 cluster bacterium]
MVIDYHTAGSILQNQAILAQQKIKISKIPAAKALKFYLAQPLKADRDYPPFDKSAVDGYALAFGNNNNNNKIKINASYHYQLTNSAEELVKTDEGALQENQASLVFTGMKIPKNSYLVVKQEDVVLQNNAVIVPEELMKKGDNIVYQASETKKNDLLIKPGQLINANLITLAAALGEQELFVYEKPSIALLATGDELVAPHKINGAKEGQIRDANTSYLSSALLDNGFNAHSLGIKKDSLNQLTKVFQQNLPSYDVLITSGGAAKSKRDLTITALEKLGAKQIFYQVAIKPAKQIWVGELDSTLIFVLAGNPLSMQLSFKIYVLPFLQTMSGKKGRFVDWLSFKLARSVENDINLDRLWPFYFAKEDDYQTIIPAKFKSSGNFIIGAKTSGFFHVLAKQRILQKSQIVPGLLW